MSKCIYQHAVEPLSLDARVRRLEHQMIELTEVVATLVAHAREATEAAVPAAAVPAAVGGAAAGNESIGS